MLLCRPHRLKPVDCKFISKVAKLVPVIPVLAKADSMTSDELQAFRKQVATSLLKVRASQFARPGTETRSCRCCQLQAMCGVPEFGHTWRV